MEVNLRYHNFLAYSEKEKKFFYTEFGDDVSIIYGRNTSGKSTLFLAILYAFGINDGNNYLKDVLEENPIFRVTCTFTKDGESQTLVLIRDDETLYVKVGEQPVRRFNGIAFNNSNEHIKLKEYLNELFDYSLLLESKNEYRKAPIETMFLPYYVSQSVGWIYLRKSFSSLEFFKNFKEDYLDYYLGLAQAHDRVKRHELQARLKVNQDEIDLIASFATKDEDIQMTRITDEQFVATSGQYVEGYAGNYSSLTEYENDYVLRCNELGFLEERRAILQKVRTGLRLQQPDGGNCPACYQTLPLGLTEFYTHQQETNDTIGELASIRGKIKDTQSLINSLQKAIKEKRDNIAKEYAVLHKYINNGMSYERWLKNKANVELITNLNTKIGELTVEKVNVQDELKKYQSDEELEKARNRHSRSFGKIFLGFLEQLGVKKLEEDRYVNLYEISAFPSQGVELHKTILAYHFALVHLISKTENTHRLPFMLDAIFKEDIEEINKERIVQFISSNRLRNTQTIISIAYSSEQTNNAFTYNEKFFNGDAKMIAIGDGEKERAFLREYKDQILDLVAETLSIMVGDIL